MKFSKVGNEMLFKVEKFWLEMYDYLEKQEENKKEVSILWRKKIYFKLDFIRIKILMIN